MKSGPAGGYDETWEGYQALRAGRAVKRSNQLGDDLRDGYIQLSLTRVKSMAYVST